MSSPKARSAATAGKTRRPRDSLSREVILEAAEAIAVREGIDGLTFAALGQELNAHATSIYRHFRDKDELVLELIDVLRAKSYDKELTSTGDWREDLRFTAKAIHANYQRYPSLAQQMAVRTTRRPTEFRNVEFALDALHRAGLDDAAAATTLRVFGNFVRSASALEAAVRALPDSQRTTDELAWAIEYRQLPAEEFPNISRIADDLMTVGDPQIFDEALEMMLDAIQLRVERQQGTD